MLALLDADTSEAIVPDAEWMRGLIGRDAQIVRISLVHRVVGSDLERAPAGDGLLPAHERLGELERAVLDPLRIEAPVRREVDVFEKDAVERGRDWRARLPDADLECLSRTIDGAARHYRHSAGRDDCRGNDRAQLEQSLHGRTLYSIVHGRCAVRGANRGCGRKVRSQGADGRCGRKVRPQGANRGCGHKVRPEGAATNVRTEGAEKGCAVRVRGTSLSRGPCVVRRGLGPWALGLGP